MSAPALAGAGCPPDTAPLIQVGGQGFRAEVAATEGTRARGLSGRPTLAADAGMWFELERPGYHGFWMKDMTFPIDLIWISPSMTVLGSVRLEPCGGVHCPIVTPPAPVLYVLEVKAGTFAGRPGDQAGWRCQP